MRGNVEGVRKEGVLFSNCYGKSLGREGGRVCRLRG